MRHLSRRVWPLVCLLTIGCAGLSPGPDSGLNTSDTVAVAAPPGAPPKRPSKNWLRVSQYAICTDFTIDPTDPLFRDVESLPGQVQDELKLPPGNNVIQVFLFETQESYEAYMTVRYPKLPTRRAYFIAEPRAASGDDLLVYTWMGDHLRTDLRHELTHAILHGVLKTVPLWLDEGLAGFFELPPDSNGFSSPHHESLTKNPFAPDLARLETLGKVSQMEKPEYREAWAWVHLMLRGDPKAKSALLAYVHDLRTNVNPGPLRVKLKDAHAEPEAALVDHLAKVGRGESVGPAPAGR